MAKQKQTYKYIVADSILGTAQDEYVLSENEFYRIRDGLAHGKFKLRYSETNKKVIVIQDDDGYNVTARIIIKLDTLLSFVSVIDMNRLI